MTRYTWDESELRDAVRCSISIAQVLRALGMRVAGGNYSTIKRRIADLGLDTRHWLGEAHLRGKTHSWSRPRSLESVLRAGSRYGSYRLKRRLLKAGIFQPICATCSCSHWLGHPIPLELDHIDGDRENNCIENLRLLCPNCHALTPTYRAKNMRHAHIPPLGEIIAGIAQAGGLREYAKTIGVSKDAVRYWLKSPRLQRLSKVEENKAAYRAVISPGGGIGIRRPLKMVRRKACRFESDPGHQNEKAKPRGLAIELR
jgi:hypothetical protein